MAALEIVDGNVYHNWVRDWDIAEYLSEGWQAYLGVVERAPNRGTPGPSITPRSRYPNPLGEVLEEARGRADAHPASELSSLQRNHLDKHGITRAVLSHHVGLGLPGIPNTRLGNQLIRAANDYMLQRWVGADPRLYGAIIVPTQTPDAAVAEIERLAGNPRVAAVMMAVNGLAKPFGHEVYHPIYRAASDAGLPIIVHATADVPVDVDSHPTAGGLPATFSELYVHAPLPTNTHVMSLIGQGAFERFPDLRVMALGVGVGWLVPALLRAESGYKEGRRSIPWTKRSPLAYFQTRIRIGTHPFDRTDPPERLLDYLATIEGIENMLCFTSGYPSWDCDAPQDVMGRIPDSWHAKVFSGNAERFFRWPSDAMSAVAAETGVRQS